MIQNFDSDQSADLIKRLRSISNRSEIIDCLKECQNLIRKNSNLVQQNANFVENQSNALEENSNFSFFTLAETLLEISNPSILGFLTKFEHENLFLAIFRLGPPIDVLLLCHKTLKDIEKQKQKRDSDSDLNFDLKIHDSTLNFSNSSYLLEKLLQIFIDFLKNNRLKFLLAQLCQKSYSDMNEQFFNAIIIAIISIPTIAANVLKGKLPEQLQYENYAKFLSIGFLNAFEICLKNLIKNENSTLKFHCELFGKLHLNGFSKFLLKIIVPFLHGKCSMKSRDRNKIDLIDDHVTNDHFLWTKIARRFFTGLPRMAIEGVLTEIIQSDSIYKQSRDNCTNSDGSCDPLKIDSVLKLSSFLGDSILNDEKIRLVLTKKLIFQRYFDNPRILLTIFQYLNEYEKSRSIILDIFLDVLRIWCSESAILQTPVEQHLYHCQAIVIALSFMTPSEIQSIKSRAIEYVMKGLQAHLLSPREQIRLLGMATGEILTKSLENDPKNDVPELKFEYLDDEKTKFLKFLWKNAKNLVKFEEGDEISAISDSFMTDLFTYTQESNIQKIDDENVIYDSDDDLEPYFIPPEDNIDFSKGTTISEDKTGRLKKPIYLRDCLEILLDDKTTFPQFDLAFRNIENLVKRDSPDLQDVAQEIVKILLHLEDKYAIENFDEIRLSAMVSICVKCPTEISQFLTDQFYARNFCLQRRLDILDVLRASAKELSDPEQTRKALDESKIDENLVESPKNQISDVKNVKISNFQLWRDVIDQRLRGKTRYFNQNCQKSSKNCSNSNKKLSNFTPKPVENRFSKLAPHFFYPLLAKFDRPPDGTLDLVSRDYFILVRLMYTLGFIIQCSKFCPDSVGMCGRMFEFGWTLRRHKEPLVRQGVLYCFLSAVTCLASLGQRLLVELFADFLLELRHWLENEASKDADAQVRQTAGHVIGLLAQEVANEMNAFVELARNDVI